MVGVDEKKPVDSKGQWVGVALMWHLDSRQRVVTLYSVNLKFALLANIASIK